MATEQRADRTEHRRFIPYVVLVTVGIALVPLWLANWLTGGDPVASTLISIGLALVIGRLGAALWQRTDASQDLVFDDLFAWGFIRRIRAQDRVMKSARRLGLQMGEAQKEMGLTRADQTKLLKRLAADLERGDPYTHGHSQRVARHAFMIAKTMHLPRKQREKVRLAALLHDVGKLNVDRDVLNKPGRLTEAEFGIIKTHPGEGADMVALLGDDELTSMIRYHHERMDGTGYPERRSGTDIPVGARIIAVADTFDAITSKRPYRPAQKHKVAIEILEREAGTQLDPEVVRSFLLYYSGRRSIRWWFVLANGWRHGFEALLAGAQRIGLVGVANAAAVGGAAVAIAGGGIVAGQVAEKAQPHERQRIVREAREDGRRAPGLSIADQTSDGRSTAHASSQSSGSNDRDGSDRPGSGGDRERRRRTASSGTTEDAPGRSEKKKGAPQGDPDGTKGAELAAARGSDGSASGPSTAAVRQEADPAAEATEGVKEGAPAAAEPAAPAAPEIPSAPEPSAPTDVTTGATQPKGK